MEELVINLTEKELFSAIAKTLNELGLQYNGPFGQGSIGPGSVSQMTDWILLAKNLGFPGELKTIAEAYQAGYNKAIEDLTSFGRNK